MNLLAMTRFEGCLHFLTICPILENHCQERENETNLKISSESTKQAMKKDNLRMFPLRMPDNYFEAVRDRAKSENVSQVEVVRKAVKLYLTNPGEKTAS